jgi:protein TonB
MVTRFSEDRLLLIMVVASLAIHMGIFLGSRRMPQPAVFAVKKAPSSLEIRFVMERIQDPPVATAAEKVITTKDSPLKVAVQRETAAAASSAAVQSSLLQPVPISSEASQGAQSEAKPLDHQNPAPHYPLAARRRGWEGLVLLNVRVQADGRVGQVSVIKSSGYDLLDRTAMQAVESWWFEPARMGSEPVSSTIRLPVEFKLENL